MHDYIITDINYEYQNKMLKIYSRYDSDDEGVVLKFLGVKRLNIFAADEIHFAWLDKNNEIIPLTEGRLNPVWRILNYETGKYEDVRRHFEVYEVGE